jgi:hypothetical protein
MSSPSEPSSPIQNESTKPKRLPRSAKKRLRYERLRQQHKLGRKKKKTRIPSSIPSISSESNFIYWKLHSHN